VRNPCRYDNQKAAELEEYARFQAEEEQRQSIIESERKRMLLEHAVRLMEFLPKGTLQRPEDLEMLLEVLMVRPALATLVGRALHLPSLTIHPADACCSPRRRGGERSSRRGRHSVDGATASLCHPPPSEGAHNQLDCKKNIQSIPLPHASHTLGGASRCWLYPKSTALYMVGM
jgi:hypothetical protein